MLFWWLTIGFAVVWAIAVVIEMIWFWAPEEEPESSPGSISEGTGDAEAPTEGGRYVSGMAKPGG